MYFPSQSSSQSSPRRLNANTNNNNNNNYYIVGTLRFFPLRAFLGEGFFPQILGGNLRIGSTLDLP